MKKVIILMGVPGSGKGTQAVKIADKFGYGHISTGNLLRALDADSNADPQDKQMLQDMKAGKLVTDKLIYKLAFREMEKYFDKGKGVILDGAIRNLEQAKEYQKFFEEKGFGDQVLVVDVHITDETSLKRLMYRKETANETRADDDPEIMKKRIKEQGNSAIKPILDYYDDLGLLKTVDGEPSIEDVEKNIDTVLQN